MAELVVETPEGLTLRYEIAGAGSRSAAALIDFSIWAFAMTLLVILFGVILDGIGGFVIWIVAGWILALISYHVLFGVVWNGATPGKRLLGLSVVDEEGLPATVLQHVLRSLFWPVEAFILVPIPFAVVLMAATPRHQRLGDRVAGTLVLRQHVRRLRGEPLREKRWSDLPNHRLELAPVHAARFDGTDVDFLRELIGRRGTEASARSRQLRRAARHYAKVLELEPGPSLGESDARALLGELYLFLREMRTRD